MPDTHVNLYNLVAKHDFLFYTTPQGPEARSEVQINMMDIDHLKWVMDGESFMKASVDVLTQKRTREQFCGRPGKASLLNLLLASARKRTKPID